MDPSLENENAQLRRRVAELENELKQERESRFAESVHLEDAKHRIQARVEKRLKNETKRLEEALMALSKDPPKLHIVKHYLSEALNNLDDLREETK